MTKENQIRALAEVGGTASGSELESYDAIIPLLRKQNYTIKARMIRFLQPNIEWDCYGVSERVLIQELEVLFLATPPQLAEALLKAHGLWKD